MFRDARTRWWGRQSLAKVAGTLSAVCVLAAGAVLKAQATASQIEDITGDYHFLSPDDTLAILQEGDMLKGYIDVFQGESESDVVLSYPLTIGSRKGDHVEFRTRRIHEKYYRFSGSVERGNGSKKGDPDYLRLVGELQIITVQPGTEKEVVERRQVVFKSKGKSEGPS
jgi:hypothetical protein